MSSFPTSLAVLLLAGCGSVSGGSAAEPAAPDPRETLSATEILQFCQRAYASCETYRDRGSVQVSIRGEGAPATESRVEFTTLFRRPDALLIEIEGEHFDEGLEYSIRSWNGIVEVIWNERRSEEPTLEEALTSANGLCEGVPCLITKLLLPEANLVGMDLRRMEALSRLPDEPVDGFGCFRIQGREALPQWHGSFPDHYLVTYWIGREDGLIRRVRMRAESSAMLLETSHELAPEVDRAVSDRELEN